jgi:hypothetical protein
LCPQTGIPGQKYIGQGLREIGEGQYCYDYQQHSPNDGRYSVHKIELREERGERRGERGERGLDALDF